MLPLPHGSAPALARRWGTGTPEALCSPSEPPCGFGPIWGHLGMLAASGDGNQGWHHPAAPDREQVWSLCALILGKWWEYSPPRGEQTATGVLIYKACPLKLTGLCKDLLHPALRRAIRAGRDFATYVGRKRGVREAGEELSISP